jgi:plastocyanin
MTTRRTSRRAAVVGIVALSALLVGCGSDSDTSSPTTTTSESGTDHSEHAVDIKTFQFDPETIEVEVGDTVTWTNGDAIVHTVTSGTREYDPNDSGRVTKTTKSGQFDEELDGKGSTAQATFDEPGTYHYFCDRHPGMEADVEVS